MSHKIIVYENKNIKCCGNLSCNGCKYCDESKDDESFCKEKCSKELFNKLEELCKKKHIEAIKLGYDNDSNKVIKCSGHTGYFQLDDVEFIIYPKIDKENPDAGTKIFWNLVGATDKFTCIKAGTDSSTELGKNKLIRELIITFFCSMMDTLFKKGIKKFYSPEEDNLPYLKGKIKFSEHIKRNITSKEKFYCEYDEFTDDIPENRILKLACQYIFSISKSEENKKNLRRYMNEFGDIEGSKNLVKDFSKILPNRMYQHYETPLDYAEAFLNHKYFWPRRGKKKFPAILFQLYDLFENYIYKLLENYKEKNDVKFYISNQFGKNKPKNYLFPENDMFMTKMDFLLRNNYEYEKSTKYLILDTKYKIINFNNFNSDATAEDVLEKEKANENNETYKNTHVTSADLYQVFTYSEIIKQKYKYKTEIKYGDNETTTVNQTPHVEVALLYPQNDSFKELKPFHYFNGLKITFIPVDLTKKYDEPNEMLTNFIDEYFSE